MTSHTIRWVMFRRVSVLLQFLTLSLPQRLNQPLSTKVRQYLCVARRRCLISTIPIVCCNQSLSSHDIYRLMPSSTVVQLSDAHLRQSRLSAFDFIVAWYLPLSSPAVAGRRRRSPSTYFVVVYRRPVLGRYRQVNIAAWSWDWTANTFQSLLRRHLHNVEATSSHGQTSTSPSHGETNYLHRSLPRDSTPRMLHFNCHRHVIIMEYCVL